MCLLVRFITQICSLKPIYTHLKNQHLASNFSHWSALSDDFWSWHSELLLDGKCKNQWIDPKCNMTSVPKLPLKGTCSLSNKLILAQCLKIRLYKNIALRCNVSSFFCDSNHELACIVFKKIATTDKENHGANTSTLQWKFVKWQTMCAIAAKNSGFLYLSSYY